jgi:hypothetical protein
VRWGDLSIGSSNGCIDTNLEMPTGIKIAQGFLDLTLIRFPQRCESLLSTSEHNWKNILMPKSAPQPLNGNSKSLESFHPLIVQSIEF